VFDELSEIDSATVENIKQQLARAIAKKQQ
jgi:hypothetical protein